MGAIKPSLADSDGYYCLGLNYVAYELSHSEPAHEGHNLYVVRLGGKEAIAEPEIIKLPDFQLHGMQCMGGRVRLLGWEAFYDVIIGDETIELGAVDKLEKAGSIPKGFNTKPVPNLGEYSEAALQWWRGDMGVIPVDIPGDESDYQIRIKIKQPGEATPCQIGITTSIIQLGEENRIAKSLEVLNVRTPVECGE